MAAGKPAIFVPFPRAADDHQKRNAEALERAGAAVMAEEKSLTRESLMKLVSTLLKDPETRASMAQAAHKFAHPQAASEIAEMAATLAGVK
jgi:UDP-N-acetylglucosamine--N-acetylmuramyl-(pentapeptide) pyrophosphoryl-undecaprenol N-acetylglucosamine transferase